jgi:hypothetical protein
MKKAEDFIRFSQMWAAAWSGCFGTISEDGIKLDFECLKPYSLEQVWGAVKLFRADPSLKTKGGPMARDIIRYIEGTAEERANRAWDSCQIGFTGGKKSEDPVANAIIKGMGGYGAFGTGRITLDDFARKRFIEAYVSFLHTPHLADPDGSVFDQVEQIEDMGRDEPEQEGPEYPELSYTDARGTEE